MLLKFNFGFEYGGFQYGWLKKELYRLPSISGRNRYGLKKLSKIKVGNNIGYRIKRQKFSMEQLKQRTITIENEIQVVTDKIHLP